MGKGPTFSAMLNETSKALRSEAPEAMRSTLSELKDHLTRFVEAERGPSDKIGFREFIRQDFEKVLAECNLKGGKVAEIGGPHNSTAEKIDGIDCEFLSIYPEVHDPRVRTADITYCPQIPDNSYDAILSVSVLEHVSKPWAAAKEMTRILKPNGIVYHAAPFSYFYHGAPMDFWRYTPDAFKVIFPALKCLKAEFYSANRRRNNVGSDYNPVDRDGGQQFSPDAFGGWRENWFTFYVGQKSGESLKQLRIRRTHQLVVDVVAALTDQKIPEGELFGIAERASAYLYIDDAGDPRLKRVCGTPKMKAAKIQNLWRSKRKRGLLPTPAKFAIRALLADVLAKELVH